MYLQVTVPIVTFPLRNMIMKSSHVNLVTYISTRLSSRFLNISSYVTSCVSTETTLSCIIIITTSAMSIALRYHISAVCGFIGSFVTTINSIVLPIIFYHGLNPSNISLKVYCFHGSLLLLSLLVIVYGVSSSLCDILVQSNESDRSYCSHFVYRN